MEDRKENRVEEESIDDREGNEKKEEETKDRG